MTHLLRRALCLGLVLTTVISIAACNINRGRDEPPAITGHYTLVSVNNKPLPTVIDHAGVPLRVVSGSFDINPDQTCRSHIVMVPPHGQETERDVLAHYTEYDGTLTMSWENAGTTQGTVKGEDFTMLNEGMTFKYRK